MTSITNEEQLLNAMGDIASEVVEEVSARALYALRVHILQDTYMEHGSNQVYFDGSTKATGEFLYSWGLGAVVKGMPSITQELFQNWESMTFDRDKFLHGSKYSNPNDVREDLANILNRDKDPSSRLWLAVKIKPFWDLWLEDLFDNGNLDQWFREGFANRGVIQWI